MKPEELKGNEAVNTLLANPPNKKKGRATVSRGVENCGCFVQHFTVKINASYWFTNFLDALNVIVALFKKYINL